MDSPIRILHKAKDSTGDYVDVSRYVSVDSFPEYFEKSLKGKGWFEFEVKSFDFSMLITELSPAPKRLDWIRIYSNANDSLLMDGFIDEVKDELADAPNFVIFPNALLLKDTIIGEVEESSDEDDETYIYESGATMPLWELVQDIINKVNIKAGTTFTTSEEAVPIVESTNKNFFGNMLDKLRAWSFMTAVLNFLWPFFNLSDNFKIYRKTDNAEPSGYKWYLVKKDAGFFSKTFISQGAFLSWTPSWGFYLGWPFNKTYGFSWHVYAPGSDWRIPTLMAKYFVYRLEAGGMGNFGEPNHVYEWFPMWPWSNSSPQLANFGSEYDANGSTNISSQKMRKFLDEEGYSNQAVKSSFDYDDGNTYAILTGKPKKFDLSPWSFFASFETPFDNYYRVTYKNATASDILKHLSIVSNRYFYVDDNNVVFMVPRETDTANKTINRDNIIDLKQNTIKEVDTNMDFDAYTTDDKGKVQSYGVRVRQREKDSILAYYKKYFQGDRIERKVELYTGVEEVDINLMDQIDISADEEGLGGQVLGRVIKSDMSFLEKKRRFTCEIASDFVDMSNGEGYGGETGGDGLEDPDPDDDGTQDPYISLYTPQSNTSFGNQTGFSISLNWNSAGVSNVDIIFQRRTQSGFYEDYQTIFSNETNNGGKLLLHTAFNVEIHANHKYGFKVCKTGQESEIYDVIRPLFPNFDYGIIQ